MRTTSRTVSSGLCDSATRKRWCKISRTCPEPIIVLISAADRSMDMILMDIRAVTWWWMDLSIIYGIGTWAWKTNIAIPRPWKWNESLHFRPKKYSCLEIPQTCVSNERESCEVFLVVGDDHVSPFTINSPLHLQVLSRPIFFKKIMLPMMMWMDVHWRGSQVATPQAGQTHVLRRRWCYLSSMVTS